MQKLHDVLIAYIVIFSLYPTDYVKEFILLDIKIKDFLLGNNLNLEAHTLGSLQNGRQRAQGAQPFTLTFTLDPRLQFFSSLQMCVSIYTM